MVANGSLVPVNNGTEIRLSLGMSRYGKLNATTWLILWPISVLVLAVDTVHPPLKIGVVLFIVLTTLPLGALLLGRWRAQKRAEEIMNFLIDLLDPEVNMQIHGARDSGLNFGATESPS